MRRRVIFCPSLQDAFDQVGIVFPKRSLVPGKLIRFATNERRDDTAGWCMLFEDGVGAVFGCHREGSTFTWQMRDTNAPKPSPAERQAAQARAMQARKEAVHQLAIRHAKVAQTAAHILTKSSAYLSAHEYVTRKRIKPYCARQGLGGLLIVPVYGPDGALQSLQFIGDDGTKRSLRHGQMKGGRLFIGTPKNGLPMILVEGWATGCSVYEATGITVVVAFSGQNLRIVAVELRKQLPDSPLLIAGDLDEHKGGMESAQSASVAGSPAVVVMPSFKDARVKGDFNDLHQAEGLAAVHEQIGAAIEKPVAPKVFTIPQMRGCDVRDGTSSTRPLTEHGNAMRLYDVHGDRLRYVYETKSWIEWKDGSWTWDIAGAAVRSLAAAVPNQIYAEGAQYIEQGQHFSRWARASQQQRIITSSVTLLADSERIRMPLAKIDADAMLVGLDKARQIINLNTGVSRPAVPSDYITKSLNVSEIGSPSEAVRWMAFLEEAFEGNQELIDWLHRCCGYMLTGSTAEQFLVFAYGLGANGKSIFAETLRYVLGDYARAIAPETLTASRRQPGGASPDLAALIGARLALSSEIEEGAPLAETLVKSLVSGDSMSVRQLYSAPVQFTPVCKLLILGNHKPVIGGHDLGIWRRIRLVPFNRTFSPKERDPHLLDKLKAEAPHILAWMVQGCLEWKRRGLADLPAAIRKSTDEYKKDQDIVGEWLAEHCTNSPASETSLTDLYSSYRTWCEENGHRPSNSKVLGRRLTECGYEVRKSNGKSLRAGIALIDCRRPSRKKWVYVGEPQ